MPAVAADHPIHHPIHQTTPAPRPTTEVTVLPREASQPALNTPTITTPYAQINALPTNQSIPSTPELSSPVPSNPCPPQITPIRTAPAALASGSNDSPPDDESVTASSDAPGPSGVAAKRKGPFPFK